MPPHIGDSELCLRTQNGCDQSATEIVQRYTPLVIKLVNRTHIPPRIELDDLIQVGLIALLLAARKWSPAGGAAFQTIAWVYVRNAIWKEIIRESKHTSNSQNIPDDLDEIERHDNTQDTEAIDETFAKLDPIEVEALTLTYGLNGHPLGTTNAGKRLGLTRNEVKRRLEEAARKIREQLQKEVRG